MHAAGAASCLTEQGGAGHRQRGVMGRGTRHRVELPKNSWSDCAGRLESDVLLERVAMDPGSAGDRRSVTGFAG